MSFKVQPKHAIRVLSQVANKVSRSDVESDRIELLIDGLESLGLRTPEFRIRVALLDSEMTSLVYRYHTGEIAPALQQIRVDLPHSLSGFALQNLQPTMVFPNKALPRVLTDPMICSVVTFPLISNARKIGVLTIDSTRKGAFPNSLVEVLQPFVTLAAASIDDSDLPLATDVMAHIKRFRERHVLVLGKDNGPEFERLRLICDSLKALGYIPMLVKEYPDIPELSNEEKVRIFADHSRFVVLENSVPAGQIAEIKMCATNRIITATVRQSGAGSSFMVTDYFIDFDFMSEFEYLNADESLTQAIKAATKWAESKTDTRVEHYNAIYPWRSN